ncbi:MAG: type II toxin-antitoxin system VapB family antitoxin [Hyphomicrobiaceae bacterium]
MPAIHISDVETIELVERLAETLGCTKTAAINRGMREALESRSQSTTVEMPKPRGGLKAQLHARLHHETVKYVRLREEISGKKSGSRVYGMLNRHGPVETVRRLVMGGPSEGLRFLAEHDRLELAAENAAIDPAYESLIQEDVRQRALQNLDYAREIIQRRER